MPEDPRMSPSDHSSSNAGDSLLDGVRNGDPRSWREFVSQHEGRVAATVIGMVGRGPDAEDIGQEVFIQFFRHVHSFRGDSQMSTYLTRSAINLSLNAIKKRSRLLGRFSGPPEETLASAGIRPDRRAELSDFSERVAAAIRTLRAEYRAVVVLRLVQGLSTSETAQVLEIPPGTVMSRLSRGQKRLRNLLREFAEVS
jgi:RNA polymerase sigma-70 factor, ECF subfamily